MDFSCIESSDRTILSTIFMSISFGWALLVIAKQIGSLFSGRDCVINIHLKKSADDESHRNLFISIWKNEQISNVGKWLCVCIFGEQRKSIITITIFTHFHFVAIKKKVSIMGFHSNAIQFMRMLFFFLGKHLKQLRPCRLSWTH